MLVVVAVVVVGGIILGSAHASLTADSNAIAKVGMPLGGGTIESVTVVTGPHSQRVPVEMRGDQIWPRTLVPADQKLTVDVVVKRPGWISWLAGSKQKLHLTITTPVASLRSHFLSVGAHQPLRLRFKDPVQAYSYGVASGHLHRHVLAKPSDVIRVPREGSAGTFYISAQPRSWESSHQAAVSYFPSGGAASAVASPAPGSVIKSSTPITLTFSKPVSKALDGHLPPVPGGAQGSWHQISSHSIVFQPQSYGYGLGAKVQIGLPTGVNLVGSPSPTGTWTVPTGSTARLQQLLALLHYLPLKFKYSGSGAGVALTPAAQEAAAVKPPAGKFSWTYSSTPSWLVSDWQPGAYGEVTKAAVMAFETNVGMTADGVDGPQVWRALFSAVIRGQRNGFGYTVADVNESSQSLVVWHNGKTVVTTPVNTGISSAPTAQGTFAVYEHLPVTTMSGTNPDGSHYSDPGIPDVSYFNGGDALHGFLRAQYGFPQSLGCVEMSYANAAQVYPYTPVGTIVHVS
jgi:peptidoglycan hydrolase-like protein with peptidoglycan-binding domain